MMFRRIHGRIVPIKNAVEDANKIAHKTTAKDIPAIGTAVAGVGVSAASGIVGAKFLKDSWKSYGRSAHIRGGIKLMRGRVPEAVLNSTYREAAGFKLAGKALAKRGFGLVTVGTAIGSGLAGYGAYKYLKNKTSKDKSYSAASTLGAVASGVGITLFARGAKLKHIVGALRLTGKANVSDLSSAWAKMGQKRTRDTVAKYADMARKKTYSKTTKEAMKTVSKLKGKKIDPNQMRLF